MKVSVTDSDIAALLNIFEQQYPEMPEISVIINLGAFLSQVIFVAMEPIASRLFRER